MKQWKEIFVFTRRERIGIITLVLFIIILIISPGLFRYFPHHEFASWQLAEIILQDTGGNIVPEFPKEEHHTSPTQEYRLFPFDPNQAGANELTLLGIPKKIVNTIIRFRERGGKFYHAEDIKKIYGMEETIANRLIPYIRIHSDNTIPEKKNVAPPAVPFKENFSIEINSADRTEWIKLKGIGPVLASRIIRYRNSLGGFYAIEQLQEVYGLKEEVYEAIKPNLRCNSGLIKKMNIHTVSEKQLSFHPYFKKEVAKMLIRYRAQHGNFNSPKDLENILEIDKAALEKMLPYLEFNDNVEDQTKITPWVPF